MCQYNNFDIDTDANVAVIMSVYKSDNPEHLQLAIDSLLNQTTACHIYVYIDGPIPIELKQTLDKYSNFHNFFIYASSINKGLACALNSLIEVVVTKSYNYIARMDSDDISRCQRIEKQVLFMNQFQDVSVCGTFCSEFGSSFSMKEKRVPLIHEELVDYSIIRCPFIHPTVMFRRTIFDAGFRYPVDTKLTEDLAFWFILLQHGFKFANIEEILLDYRLNESTLIRRRGIYKGIGETLLRLDAMIHLNRFTFLNLTRIMIRPFLHILPMGVLRFFYRYFR